MKIKKAVSIVLSLAMTVQMLSVSAFAVDNKGELPEMAQVVIGQNDFGEVKETRTLYDANDDEVAVCLDFDNAYLIYLNNGVVIEYSSEENSDYFGSEEKAYYAGPLAYHKQEKSHYVDIVSDEIVSEETFEKQSDTIQKVEVPDNNSKSSVSMMKTALPSDEEAIMLPYRLRLLDYNRKGTCVALATTIMLFYYYDHVSTDYIKNPFFVQNPKALHDFLVSRYFQPVNGEYGQTISESLFETNKFFYDQNIDNSAKFTYYSGNSIYGQVFHNIVDRKRPIIMYLHENSESLSEWAINHAVIVHGITSSSVYGQRGYAFYYVNDGAGHNSKAIFDSSAYITGFLWYTKL